MSVDTTVVVFGRANPFTGAREYTACVVQAAQNLEEVDETALRAARHYTRKDGQPWFTTLSRAKQFAHLIAEEECDAGSLEYEGTPLYYFDDTGVYRMTEEGKIHHSDACRYEWKHSRRAA